MSAKSAKPPLPKHVVSSPRFKKKKPNFGNNDSALAAVRKLTNTEASIDHFQEFFDQIGKEKNDRGAAILVATNLENALRYAIARRLAISKDHYDYLFGMNGPIHTFEHKIRLGSALSIFRSETHRNLELIRAIRNAFAHAGIPITFVTPEIQSACHSLVVPFVLYPKSVKIGEDGKVVVPDEPRDARSRFTVVCQSLTHNLLLYGTHCFQKPRRHTEDDRYNAWITPEPLA